MAKLLWCIHHNWKIIQCCLC